MLNILQEILNIQPDEDIIALLEEEIVIAHFLCACIATYRSFVLCHSFVLSCHSLCRVHVEGFLNTCTVHLEGLWR